MALRLESSGWCARAGPTLPQRIPGNCCSAASRSRIAASSVRCRRSPRHSSSSLRTVTAGGAALAAAGLLITGHCMHSYRRFAERANLLSGLRDGSIAYADHGDALIAHSGLLCGLLLLSPSDPFIDICVERIMVLLELEIDVNLRFAAGRLVLYYTEPREKRELGQRVYALLHEVQTRSELTPHRLGRWLIVWMRNTGGREGPRTARARARGGAPPGRAACRTGGCGLAGGRRNRAGTQRTRLSPRLHARSRQLSRYRTRPISTTWRGSHGGRVASRWRRGRETKRCFMPPARASSPRKWSCRRRCWASGSRLRPRQS